MFDAATPAAPTPGICYEPFGPPGESPAPSSAAPYSTFKPFSHVPAESPAPYSTFKLVPGSAPAPPSPAGSEDESSSRSGNSSPEGIYVSAEDVAALQRWAEERESVNERLNHVEKLASEREREADELRRRLKESEEALEKATKFAEEQQQQQQPQQQERRMSNTDRAPLQPVLHARHTKEEANALASQRKVDLCHKKQQENSALLDEWRKLRSAR